MARVDFIQGDARSLPLADHCVDAVITDPPYHLTAVSRNGSPRQNDPATPFGRTRLGSGGFMGETWDGGDVAFRPELWIEVMRVSKPGAHLLAFGGTRTFHRLACAIEDAGWEIRDCCMWLYGSGFPKSLDVSKAIDKAAGAERKIVGRRTDRAATPKMDIRGGRLIGGKNGAIDCSAITAPATADAQQWNGWGTALKPAWEPIILARKPLSESGVADNVIRWGVGALNIDAGRIAGTKPLMTAIDSESRNNPILQTRSATFSGQFSTEGRWPANVLLAHHPDCIQIGQRTVKGDGRGECDGKRPGGFGNIGSENGDGEPNARVYGDETVPVYRCHPECAVRMLDEQSGDVKAGGSLSGSEPSRPFNNCYGEMNGRRVWQSCGDSGGASRFFYTSKASRSERNAGCDDLPERPLNWSSGEQSPGTFRAEGTNRAAKNYHPTVKPVDLCRYLCRLVTPRGGLILDPFSGSGSTGIAASLDDFNFVGIERQADYIRIAKARAAWWLKHGEVSIERYQARQAVEDDGEPTLFSEAV